MSKSGGVPTASLTDFALENSVGADGWPEWAVPIQFAPPARAGCSHPFYLTNSDPPRVGWAPTLRGRALEDSYLVDSASSHMLVSKIKPCMSKYKQLYGETANGSLNQLSFI